MSSIGAPVVRLEIVKHPKGDFIEIAKIAGYQSIVQKGDFKTGDLAVYLPEQVVLPVWLIEKLGLVDRLAGAGKNRIKAIKLRGTLSQGIVCPIKFVPTSKNLKEGDNCFQELGLSKYEPPVPIGMSGDVWNAGPKRTINYDIENIKKYPDVFVDGEEIVICEKLHGSLALYGLMPIDIKNVEEGRLVVSSKGRAARGLAYKTPVPALPLSFFQRCKKLFLQTLAKIDPVHKDKLEVMAYKIKNQGINENNVYWKVYRQYDVFKEVPYSSYGEAVYTNTPIFILGEIIGVQDLTYGYNSGNLGFRVFDIYLGTPGQGRYLNDLELGKACHELKLERVPVLYRGPYSKEVVLKFTSGKETTSGLSLNIREGVVVRSAVERQDSSLGRVQLKSVSEEYLLRNHGTEYN